MLGHVGAHRVVHFGAQCGFCTFRFGSGPMVLDFKNYLEENKHAND
jgi:hypothetical protein